MQRDKKNEAPATQTDAPKGHYNASTLSLDSTTESVVTQDDSVNQEQIQVGEGRRHGFFIIDTEFIKDGWGAKVGPYGIAVYTVLVAHADNDNHDSWPSRETIAKMVGCSTKQVTRKIKELEELNIITYVSRKGADGKQTSNKYWLVDKSKWRSDPGDSQSPGNPRGTHSPAVPGDSQSHKLDSPYLTRLTHVRAEKPNKRSPFSDNLASKPKEGPAAGVLAEFTSITGLAPLAGQTDQFTAGALAIAREFGEQAGELMREAWRISDRGHKFQVTSPYSLMNTMNAARAAKRQNAGPERTPKEREAYKALEAQYGGAA